MGIFRSAALIRTRGLSMLQTLVMLSLMLGAPLAVADRTITVLSLVTCNKWVEDRKQEAADRPNSASLDLIWINGVLTGLNAAYPADKDFLRAVDAPTIVLWVDRHCQRFPKSDLFDAGKELFKELKKLSK